MDAEASLNTRSKAREFRKWLLAQKNALEWRMEVMSWKFTQSVFVVCMQCFSFPTVQIFCQDFSAFCSCCECLGSHCMVPGFDIPFSFLTTAAYLSVFSIQTVRWEVFALDVKTELDCRFLYTSYVLKFVGLNTLATLREQAKTEYVWKTKMFVGLRERVLVHSLIRRKLWSRGFSTSQEARCMPTMVLPYNHAIACTATEWINYSFFIVPRSWK